MVVVPAGAFMMGSSDGKDEQPIRKVTFESRLAVSRFEVTFEEWDACVARRACTFRSGDDSWGRGRQPVINISWDDARTYSGWLAKETGKPYRLLTEAEWEYAARAGAASRFSFGDDAAELGRHAWFERNSATSAHPVGEKEPNAFGLYDMHGNVWEWVEDCYRPGYGGAPADGSAVAAGACGSRVLRGGSWVDGPEALRSTYRSRSYPASRSYLIGLRVGRTLAP
jgi:formylglycine-generating enzyme required for sulfatase activity